MRRNLIFLLILFVVSDVFALDVNSVLQSAADAWKAGEKEKTLSLLIRAMEMEPNVVDLALQVGDVATSMGDQNHAIWAYNRAMTLDDTNSDAMGALSIAYLSAGRPADAEKILEKLTRVAPHSASNWLNYGTALKQLGRGGEAISAFDTALKLDPKEWRALFNKGNALYDQKQYKKAIACYDAAVRLNPKNGDIRNNLANALKDNNQVDEAIDVLQTAVRNDPDRVAALVNLATTLGSVHRVEEAMSLFERALNLAPNMVETYANMASLLRDENRLQEALKNFLIARSLDPLNPIHSVSLGHLYEKLALSHPPPLQNEYISLARKSFEEGIEVKPDFAQAYAAMAELLRREKDYSDALRFYDMAIQLEPETAAWWINKGVLLVDIHKPKEAIEVLQKAVSLPGADVVGLNNLGSALHKTADLPAALRVYKQAEEMSPTNLLVLFNLGNVHLDLAIATDLNLLHTSVDYYTRALVQSPRYIPAINNLGNALKEMEQIEFARQMWRLALRLDPTQDDVAANLLHLDTYVCDWTNRRGSMRRVLNSTITQLLTPDGAMSVQPFHALLYPIFSPETQLEISRSFARAAIKASSSYPPFFPSPSLSSLLPSPPPVRIAYISHDFGNHPTGHLFLGVPRRHSRHAVHCTLYALSHSDGSEYAKKIRDAGWEVIDVSVQTYYETAVTINKNKPHILIDFDVWMKGRRPETLALRPAPIQAVLLGYPASSGAPYMDFFVSDRISSPPDSSPLFFAEKMVFLPNTYQVNDYLQSFRSPLSLPPLSAEEKKSQLFSLFGRKNLENSILLANFNQIYKFNPETLNSWAKILKKVPAAVLWLLKFPPVAAGNLKRELLRRGVEEDRILFSDRVDKPEYLKRAALADLFVDSFLVNAHTTATESIFAGLPLLALPQDPLVSRVSASILHSAGLDALIARNQEDFETLAAQLASNPSILASLHEKIANEYTKMALFDTDTWVKDWERALVHMYEIYQNGKQPHNIIIAKL